MKELYFDAAFKWSMLFLINQNFHSNNAQWCIWYIIQFTPADMFIFSELSYRFYINFWRNDKVGFIWMMIYIDCMVVLCCLDNRFTVDGADGVKNLLNQWYSHTFELFIDTTIDYYDVC